MNVLLTNDDGINAAGLRRMHEALVARGHSVTVAAPMRQQSGVGHSLTVFEPLRSQLVRDGSFTGHGVHGTPTDCVKLGLACLAPARPDLVISGINLGPNVGPDIFYSGTVGAAAEAAHDDVPSMAISWNNFGESPALEKIAAHAAALAEKIPWKNLPPRRVVNVNYPTDFEKLRGIRVCPQSGDVWRNIYAERTDPRGEKYWWMAGEAPLESVSPGTDKYNLALNYITLTPLKFEYTDDAALDILKNMEDVS